MATSNKKLKKQGQSSSSLPSVDKQKTRSEQGHRFTAEQREHALVLVASGMERERIAKVLGATTESIRLWLRAAEAKGTMPQVPPAAALRNKAVAGDEVAGARAAAPQLSVSPAEDSGTKSPYAPKDNAEGLCTAEKEGILELKRKHPSFGPAQIRTQLKRFHGWRVSVKAIGRLLRNNGYELVHRDSRPEGDNIKRFEAPRPNALWQIDFCELRIADEKFHLLIALDDFSRFVVGHAVVDSPSSEVASRMLREAIARHGKPEAVRTDRGGAFLARAEQDDFAHVLEAELIDHIVGRPYHPQGGGKVEAIIGTVRRELWDVEHFDDRQQAERRLSEFFEGYNHRRAHMGIDGLTPADRYYGRAERVLSAIGDNSRRRQAALAQQPGNADIFEELSGAARGAPLEVLRLVLQNGLMELRFCGARVRLGKIES